MGVHELIHHVLVENLVFLFKNSVTNENLVSAFVKHGEVSLGRLEGVILGFVLHEELRVLFGSFVAKIIRVY